jgi:TPR repeat protein
MFEFGKSRRRARIHEVDLERLRHTVVRVVAATVMLGFAAPTSIAEEYRQFPGAPTDSRTLKVQERVEGIFLSGDYGRALLIYEKELAPLGDKYAQYMVGFMHLTGKGVRKNPAEALAWYRLAAERGEGPLIKARDALRESLQPAELERADARFAELWQSHGDRKLLLELISSDLDILRRGSASGKDQPVEDAAPGVSLAAGYAGTETSEGYHRRVRDRLRERLQYLASTKDAAAAGIENPMVMEKLETDVRQELRALDLP